MRRARHADDDRGRSPVARAARLAVPAALTTAVALWIGPWRETAVDDDWAYARTVEHLLATGEYRLHDWLSANPVAQIWGGALASRLLGPSFGSLRLWTLGVSLAGAAAFHGLAREHRLRPRTAGLLTLVLVACPLYVRFSFTFMTDVPFTSAATVALLLLTRALRTERPGWIVAGSLASAACVLTRQFGAALVGALALVWMGGARHLARAPLLALGTIAPLLAVAWQLADAASSRTWAGRLNGRLEVAYLTDVAPLLREAARRPAVVLQYAALFTLPLVVPVLVDVLHRRAPDRPRPAFAALAAAAAIVVGGIALSAGAGKRIVMPLLPWNLWFLLRWPRVAQIATVLAAAGAVLVAHAILVRYRRGGVALADHERLLDAFALVSFAFTVAYWQLGDEYVLVYLPYVLIVLGRAYEAVIERRAALIAAGALVSLAASTAWTRSLLVEHEAYWRGASLAVARGAPPARVAASWEWFGYHRFEEFAAAHPPEAARGFGDFFVWLAGEARAAGWRVGPTARWPGVPARVVATVPFRALPWEPVRSLYVLERDPSR